MCRKNRWNRGEHSPPSSSVCLSLSLSFLCVLWKKDNTCYLRWSYKEKFRIKFFELWYVFAHQWTVYLLRKRKCTIPELRRFVLHLIFFYFYFFFFFFLSDGFRLAFSSRIVFFRVDANDRNERVDFYKNFYPHDQRNGKSLLYFFSNITKRIMPSMLLCTWFNKFIVRT